MLQCQNCQNIYDSNQLICAFCECTQKKINNIVSWAPELAYGGGNFKAELFGILAELEHWHFWFRARNKIILWMIEKYFPKFKSFMEIGCGTGFVLSAIAKRYPLATLVGSEIFVNGLAFAAHRVPTATCVQMDARKIPYIEEFDMIGAFDVLEHIKDDETVLKNIFAALRPGGGLLLSVPQHEWLWSNIDTMACHERRYTAKDLTSKIQAAGFEILRSTSFVSFLLPAMLISRLRGQNRREFDPLDEFKINPLLNRILEGILNFESFFIKLGLNFPIGGSRFIVARKNIL